MKRRFWLRGLVGLCGLVVVLAAVPGSFAAGSSTFGWFDAIEVPGTAALNAGGFARLFSVSCGAVGDCAAGGTYTDVTGAKRALVANETNGVWGDAVEVPGTGALSSGGHASVDSVSCGAVGDCAAGGSYMDASGATHAFIASEKSGVWGDAVEVPGTAALNTGGDADLTSVSCSAAGECAAGGTYRNDPNHDHVFVVSEKKGVWGNAVKVPGTAALNTGGHASLAAVSCGAVGECAAVGSYKDGSGFQAFVVNEKKGVWGNAVEVPGTAALNSGGDARLNSVSCGAAGDCAAGGRYEVGVGTYQAFVVTEKNGVWGDAVEVPGTAALNSGGDASLNSVSCRAVGECAAGGMYKDDSGHGVFVVNEVSGVWGDAVKVPGAAALNSGGDASLNSVSCGAAGECAAGGAYKDGSSDYQAFVVSETGGVWGDAVKVPGTAALNGAGSATLRSVSCAAQGDCAAGGWYKDGTGHDQAYVVNGTGDAGPPPPPPPPPPACVVPHLVGKTLSAAKKALGTAHCGVGTIKKVYSKAKKGRVVTQSPKAGRHLKNGSKVALSVSKGRK